MNKIELLPKDLHVNNDHYQLGMWVTFFGNLCIGYRHIFDKCKGSLFSVCIEPENEPVSIRSTETSCINSYIGNAKTVDDACEEILSYIEMKGYDAKGKN